MLHVQYSHRQQGVMTVLPAMIGAHACPKGSPSVSTYSVVPATDVGSNDIVCTAGSWELSGACKVTDVRSLERKPRALGAITASPQ